MIQNFCNFLNKILFYINVIEFKTVKRIYTQFNFIQARYLIKRFKNLILSKQISLKKVSTNELKILGYGGQFCHF
jgi:hypothetical protein